MIMGSWNVRGMNDPFKIKEIKHFLAEKRITVCALLETRVRGHNMAKVQRKMGGYWSWCCNYAYSPRGRMWVGWQAAEVHLRVDKQSEQVMVAEVSSLDTAMEFILVSVYGLHTINDRKSMWSELLEVITTCNKPCIIIGDFNAVCQVEDRINGAMVSEAETQDMSDFILRGNVIEAPSVGFYYSWNNKGIGDTRIASRIDRAFVNTDWLTRFSEVKVQYLPNGVSNRSLSFDS